jgi:hypothetical protein
MLYQKMLTGDKPYYTALRSMTDFKKHKHPEIEIAYCLEGSLFSSGTIVYSLF